jgi:hypothetical protein
MQEAEGLATHDILRVVFHGYLACHSWLAAESPLAAPGYRITQSQRYDLQSL